MFCTIQLSEETRKQPHVQEEKKVTNDMKAKWKSTKLYDLYLVKIVNIPEKLLIADHLSQVGIKQVNAYMQIFLRVVLYMQVPHFHELLFALVDV